MSIALLTNPVTGDECNLFCNGFQCNNMVVANVTHNNVVINTSLSGTATVNINTPLSDSTTGNIISNSNVLGSGNIGSALIKNDIVNSIQTISGVLSGAFSTHYGICGVQGPGGKIGLFRGYTDGTTYVAQMISNNSVNNSSIVAQAGAGITMTTDADVNINATTTVITGSVNMIGAINMGGNFIYNCGDLQNCSGIDMTGSSSTIQGNSANIVGFNNLQADTYTPTFVNFQRCSNFVVFPCHFIHYANIVEVSFIVSCDVAAGIVSPLFTISLPIARTGGNFTATSDGYGTNNWVQGGNLFGGVGFATNTAQTISISATPSVAAATGYNVVGSFMYTLS